MENLAQIHQDLTCHVCKSPLELRGTGPLLGCPGGVTSYVCPVNPMHCGEAMQAVTQIQGLEEVVDYAELAKRLRANAWTCREEQGRITDPRFIAELANNAREWDDAADAIEALTSPPDEAQVDAALRGFVNDRGWHSTPEQMRVALNAAHRVRVKNDGGEA